MIMNNLYIFTGPSGVGKTTLSVALAKQLGNALVVNADDYYHEENKENIAPWEEGGEIITERMWKRCFDMIEKSLNEGKDVIFNYLISRGELTAILEKFEKYNCHFVCLMASLDELIKRDDIQPGELQMERVKVHIKELGEQGYEKHTLDTTSLSLEEEIQIILSGKFIVEKENGQYI